MSRAQRVDALATIELNAIRPNAENPRSKVEDLDDLAASIREHGLVQPLVVAALPDGTYRLIAGHRRYAALELIGAERALCVVRTPKNGVETLAMMLVENGQRVNLSPIEEARAYQRLMREYGVSQGRLGQMIGRSQAHVSQRLALLHLTPAQQAEVESGRLLVRDAKQLARERAGTADVTRVTGWHLGKTHPLADTVRALCDHTGARRLGGQGCGACWEQAIRDDERARLEAS